MLLPSTSLSGFGGYDCWVNRDPTIIAVRLQVKAGTAPIYMASQSSPSTTGKSSQIKVIQLRAPVTIDNQAPATFALGHRIPQMLMAESTGKLTAPAKTSNL